MAPAFRFRGRHPLNAMRANFRRENLPNIFALDASHEVTDIGRKQFNPKPIRPGELQFRSEQCLCEELGIITTLATLDFQDHFRCGLEQLAKEKQTRFQHPVTDAMRLRLVVFADSLILASPSPLLGLMKIVLRKTVRLTVRFTQSTAFSSEVPPCCLQTVQTTAATAAGLLIQPRQLVIYCSSFGAENAFGHPVRLFYATFVK